MTEPQAYNVGTINGKQAVENCEVGGDETLREAAFLAEQNARQYAGHMPTAIHRNDRLFDAYESGVRNGIESELEQINKR